MPDGSENDLLGDAAAAARWIASSSLPEPHRELLRRFVARFPSVIFSRDSESELDEFEREDRVALPPWLRAARSTLASPDVEVRVRFDEFDLAAPVSDSLDHAWFTFSVGYSNDEQRELWHNKAGVYRIGEWYGTDRAYLAADLQNPDDERIFEFSGQDLLDNELDGRPARLSVYPAFVSYASMLAHVDAAMLLDGTVVEAAER